MCHLLEKVGTPSGADGLGKSTPTCQHMFLEPYSLVLLPFVMCRLQKRMVGGTK
jgi:hypothetical protein